MSQKTISVLSLNTFGIPFHPHKIVRTLFQNNVRFRYRLIAQEIIKVSPDIIILQEVVDHFHSRYLQSLLPQYPFRATKSMFYGPRGGLLILSRLPLDNFSYEDFEHQGSFRDKSIAGKINRRGILKAKLSSMPLWIVNTHLTQNSDHDWGEGNRYLPLLTSQLHQVKKASEALRERGDCLILAGDFNIPKSSSLYKSFKKSSSLLDAFEKDDFPTYHENFLPEGVHVGRLDYIFYSEGLKVTQTQYILQEPFRFHAKDIFLSDHIGLQATFSL